MEHLVHFSQKYGSDPNFVLAGGGNTSMKENGVLYVKGSGCALATIEAANFVAMDLPQLLSILEKQYPDTDKEREAAFLSDVMAARLPGEENKRPSVEALLHALLPQRYVLHLHPALVNGLTCAADGESWAKKLFPNAVWVEACRPGYTLAKLLSSGLRPDTDTVLLQNHGVFFAADTPQKLDEMVLMMMTILSAQTGPLPEELPATDPAKPFTPDQIVYCGVSQTLPDTTNARLLYQDAQKIEYFSQKFGGPLPLSEELTNFIINWEAESYRKSQSK